jgi:hypothetical protein
MNCAQNFGWKPYGRRPLGEEDINGRVILSPISGSHGER